MNIEKTHRDESKNTMTNSFLVYYRVVTISRKSSFFKAEKGGCTIIRHLFYRFFLTGNEEDLTSGSLEEVGINKNSTPHQ